MRLFRLRTDDGDDDVAEERYDFSPYVDCREMLVLADDEGSARRIASEVRFYGGPMWLDAEAVGCAEVSLDQEGVVTRVTGTG